MRTPRLTNRQTYPCDFIPGHTPEPYPTAPHLLNLPTPPLHTSAPFLHTPQPFRPYPTLPDTAAPSDVTPPRGCLEVIFGLLEVVRKLCLGCWRSPGGCWRLLEVVGGCFSRSPIRSHCTSTPHQLRNVADLTPVVFSEDTRKWDLKALPCPSKEQDGSEDKDKGPCVTVLALATDARYVYLSTTNGLMKVGTGYHNTSLKVYATNVQFPYKSPSEQHSLAVVGDRLWFRSSEFLQVLVREGGRLGGAGGAWARGGMGRVEGELGPTPPPRLREQRPCQNNTKFGFCNVGDCGIGQFLFGLSVKTIFLRLGAGCRISGMLITVLPLVAPPFSA